MILRIISGGQTGSDRGALDACLALGIPHGGFCPSGRKAEDGVIPACYNLIEHESEGYPARTAANVESSDGTVIFTMGAMTPGSRLTMNICKNLGKPWLHVDLSTPGKKHDIILYFIMSNFITILNVAGSRESSAPGIQDCVETIMRRVIVNQPEYTGN